MKNIERKKTAFPREDFVPFTATHEDLDKCGFP
jgi:hypothetical protein